MKSKISLYTVIGILIFILVATICPDCAESGSREELEWQKSKKVAEGMSEEEATEAAEKIVREDLQELEDFEESGDEYLNGDEDDEDWEEQEKERIEKEQVAAEAELEEGFEEEEKLLPKEPITYSGDALGLDFVLLVNFKTTEVTGSLNYLSGGDYANASINGKINIDTFEITANYSGVTGSGKYATEVPINGTVTGIITDDLSTFNGEILNDEGEGGEFTATK